MGAEMVRMKQSGELKVNAEAAAGEQPDLPSATPAAVSPTPAVTSRMLMTRRSEV
jgi:hypothetical protein